MHLNRLAFTKADSLRLIVFGLALLATPANGSADKPDVDDLFRKSVQPLLKKHCLDCHGDEEPEAALTMTTGLGVLAGATSGPIVIPGNPQASLLLHVLVKDAEPHMPPEAQLTDAEITTISTWVAQLDLNTVVGRNIVTDEDRNHWAFRPLSTAKAPEVDNKDWARSPIDQYVLSKLEQKQLVPSERASKPTLLRRVYCNLIGLPPTPEQLATFLADAAPDAYERVVDELLASPRYGERWARHWLDLARYADSSGFHSDIDRPNAWRYRDYVIDSFNQDKPYAQFVTEQLAGDQLEHPTADSWVATAFGRNGPSNEDNMGSGLAKQQYAMDQLDDVISTTSNVFLGLTIGCARCHDHKFDPLTQRDYYSLLAYFRDTSKQQLTLDSLASAQPKLTPSPTKPSTKTAEQAVAMVLTSFGNKPTETNILWRGNVRNKGPLVQPSVPRVLSADDRVDSPKTRLQLARWITDEQNALTWRVLANRIWHYHFGRGLVATPSNFGKLGEPPTHPQLLDYLASRLILDNGRWKSLHRAIVTSSTYCQTSTTVEATRRQDPDNLLLWRMNKRRLEAEALRDAFLSVGGNLNLKMGGPGIKPRIRPELLEASQRNKWPQIKQESAEHWRRSVYIYVKRQLQLPMMEMFGAPSTAHSCARRENSLVPTQSLVLMNDDFIAQQASDFASRTQQQAGDDQSAQVSLALQIALGSEPDENRIQHGLQFLKTQHDTLISDGVPEPEVDHQALTDFCHVLMNLSEFVYVD